MEENDPEGRLLMIRPVKRESLAGLQYKATNWRLDTGEATMSCICVTRDGNHNHLHSRSAS